MRRVLLAVVAIGVACGDGGAPDREPGWYWGPVDAAIGAFRDAGREYEPRCQAERAETLDVLFAPDLSQCAEGTPEGSTVQGCYLLLGGRPTIMVLEGASPDVIAHEAVHWLLDCHDGSADPEHDDPGMWMCGAESFCDFPDPDSVEANAILGS